MLQTPRHAARTREARPLPAGGAPGLRSGAGRLISVVRQRPVRGYLMMPALLVLGLLLPRALFATSLGMIPGAASAAGENGSVWRTELRLTNENRTEVGMAVVRLIKSGGIPATVSVTVQANTSIVIRDVLCDLFEVRGLAAVELEVDENLSVSAYTISESPCGGNSGQRLPFAVEYCPPQSSKNPYEIAFRRSESERANIGLLSLGGHIPGSEARIDVFDCEGAIVGSVRFPLESLETKQVSLDAIAPGLLCGKVAGYYVWPGTKETQILYLSVIDNLSGWARFDYKFSQSCY